MFAPTKIVILFGSLLSLPKVDKPIILDGDYSLESMKYRIKNNTDPHDINNLLYKNLLKEIEESNSEN